MIHTKIKYNYYYKEIMLNSVKLYNKYKDDYSYFKTLYGLNKMIEFEYNKILLEIILQYHLIETGYRDLAQIQIKPKQKIKEIIKNIIIYL